jgi:iron complex transport system substrate-binding protein
MKKRVQSSGSVRPWGFFISHTLKTVCSGVLESLNTGHVAAWKTPVPTGDGWAGRKGARHRVSRFKRAGISCFIIGFCFLFIFSSTRIALSQDETQSMKRRQQGILTGMPFMANIASRTFVDDAGRKHYFAKAPQRVVSLAPSITEMLFALGLDEQIVGVTNFCNYPAAAELKPKIGYTRPSLEALLALKPDMVAAPSEFLRADVLAKLDELKVPVFIFQPKTLEEVLVHIHVLGRIFDRSSAADAVTGRMRERLGQMARQLEATPPIRVLYVLSSQPLLTVGPDSYIHQMIGLAHGSNIAAGAPGAYPRLSMETVLDANPEVLIFPGGSTESVPESERQTWSRWTALSAVQHERLHVVSADALNRPGPRVVDGLEQLARAIHPEAFASDTPSSQP